MSAAGHPFADSRQIVQDALDSDVGLALQKRFPQLATVALAYYRDTVREDIRHRNPADVLGAVVSQMEFSDQRASGAQPNRPAVRVFTPAVDQDGWTCEHTVVEVVADDEPFIVDSVTAALTQANSTIMVTIHPVIEVNEKRESWLHIEIDRETDREQTQVLAQTLVNVLGDVSAAVADWKLMVAKAKEVSADLRKGSPTMTAAGISASESGEAAELLQWIADDNFTLLGYREYRLVAHDSETALESVPDSGLGILRGAPQSRKSFDHLPQRVQAKARERTLLVLTKANRRSTVHRPAYLDYVGVKTFDADGNVNGERRFIGLLTAATYANSATQIPVARKTVAAAIEASGFEPGSHSARDLLHFCEIYPRDELFQVTSEQLLDVARHVIAIGERRQTRVFVRDDDYGRFASVLVYLPRDRYTTDVRIDITKILADSYGSEQIDYVARVSDSVLARLHFVVRFAQRQQPPDVDLVALNDRVSAVVESWDDQLAVALLHEFGEERATDVRNEFDEGFPDSYKADVSPRGGAADLARLLALGDDGASVRLHDELGQIPGEHRVTLYSVGRPVELSELLPVFESLGAEVLEERPYEIRRTSGSSAWIYDVGVRLSRDPDVPDDPDFADRFADAFLAIWRGDAEADSLNALISTTDLSWREVSWLRSWVAYARQIGSTFSGPYVERVLRANSAIAVLLIRMFETRLRPVDNPHAEEEWANLNATCLGAIDEVASLDADRILRQLRDIVCAIVRTNAFQTDANGSPRAAVAHKLEPRLIAGIPEPTPKFEIWVCSPRLAGVHLRFGKIARGGLRWSDRPEDMRTEILGLVKAQMVKNSVIVPVGAKGGFFVKNAVDASDRAAWLAQGLACYREFITSLLELTDNRVQGEIVSPAMTTCRDGADPYLVVAADKGTATFSDTANQIAVSHGFWLGDAFASGGSNGYDHKEMGITARGAWESVKRHFRELGVNVAVDEFTIAGIGDMSGDVFGNGMLLSNSLKLVAAFDHRHIFLDPDPDPKASFAERSRLAGLDRSSWADYNADLLSEGGGVYERTRKAVPISPQVARRLDLDESITELTPQELIHHILQAPVDLLFNGGIGTYVKASDETNLDVGDKANDAIRVNGSQLRARVVGEGGNLGLTQAGRIEASRCGVRLNTDAIDNSAGVDCSDHEVNIKILLDQVVASGDLTVKQRNELLASMTDEVAGLVLAENYRQNLVLMYARAQSDGLLPVHRRLIDDLESRGFIDRELEVIPTDAELAELQAHGIGLTSPELCVLLSWVKIALTQDVTESAIPEEAWFRRYITEYFPERIRDEFADAIAQHPLRTEIIATLVANDLVDCGGITFMYRACEETGASPVEVVRAYAVAVEVFGLREVWREISALDDEAPTTAAVALHLEVRRLLDRATRWVLALRGGTVDVGAEIAAFHDTVARMADTVDRLLRGDQRERFAARAAEFVALGSPLSLAEKVAGMLDNFSLLDIDDLATRHRESPEAVAALYFAVSDRYKFDEFLIYITELPRQDRWDNLARAAMRSDLYAVLAGLTSKIMRTTDEEASPVERIAAWEEANREGQQRASATLADLAKAGKYDLATLSVALRTLRTLIGQTRGGAED